MTYGEFVEGVVKAVAAGDVKPIWLRAVTRPDFRRMIEAVLKSR